MSAPDSRVAEHYRRQGLLDAILAGLRAVGVDPEAPTPADLAPADHFHHGGAEETDALIGLAGFTAGMHVLDAGGGIGGPARWLADRVGCRVTVVDFSADYCSIGEELTRRTGLAERVSFVPASALATPFAAGSFDGAWTQHATMNIADKAGLYDELFRVLRPGARLCLHEVMAGPNQPIHFPVPWARGPEISHLLPTGKVRAAIAAAGFRELAWHDTTARTRDWLERRLATAKQAEPPPLGVHLLLGAAAPQMFANLLRNVDEGRQVIVQAVFERR